MNTGFFMYVKNWFSAPLIKRETTWNDLKPSKTTRNHPENNLYPLKPAISYKSSSRIWNTYGSKRFSESKNLLKVLRRQATDIKMINAMPMSVLLTLNSY